MYHLTLRTAARLGALIPLAWAAPAAAGIVALVDRDAQQMRVYVDGALVRVWPVSTARSGYVTPAGQYRVLWTTPYWWSHKYGGAMPHAMFFRGGYAIHGTAATGRLGRPASHGCVRLAPGAARELYGMVRRSGGARVTIR
ncbi:L,D-transpeptidase [Methylobacterium sp. JK268]